MRTSNLSFSALRGLLLDLDFEERNGPNSQRVFEHAPSDTILVFRNYQAKEKVHLPDLISVRKQLDERGIMPADSFDTRFRKSSA